MPSLLLNLKGFWLPPVNAFAVNKKSPGIAARALAWRRNRLVEMMASGVAGVAGKHLAGGGGIQVLELVAGFKGPDRVRRTGWRRARAAAAQIGLDVRQGGHRALTGLVFQGP